MADTAAIDVDADLVWGWVTDTAITDAADAFIGVNALTAAALRLRSWATGWTSAGTVSKTTAKALPGTLEHVGIQLHCLQRQAVRRIEELLPVDDRRKEMAARRAELSTADKLQLWRHICVYRLASLVVWPIFMQLASNALCAEAALALVARARAQADTSKSGGLVGLMVSNLMASFGGAGAVDVQLERACNALTAALEPLCRAAEVAVNEELGSTFKCSDRFTAARTAKVLRAAFGKVIRVAAHDCVTFVVGPSIPVTDAATANTSDFEDDMRAVVATPAFLSLATGLAGRMFEQTVIKQLQPRVETCKDYNKEAGDAAAFQIATQLGPVLFALSDAPPQLHAATKCFASKLLAANAP